METWEKSKKKIQKTKLVSVSVVCVGEGACHMIYFAAWEYCLIWHQAILWHTS